MDSSDDENIYDPLKIDWSVTLKDILSIKNFLIELSKMNEFDITNIWIQPGEPKISDKEGLKALVYSLRSHEYNYNIPLYQEMIFKFRNCDQSPCRFYNQVDPNNQKTLASYFARKLPMNEYIDVYDKNFYKIMQFMAWLKNGLGLYHFQELGLTMGGYESWLINEIVFFFYVNEEMQVKLINMYNQLHI